MAKKNINRQILSGNLTRDVELRQVGDTTVASLRIAYNTRHKNRATGQWEDKPNYKTVTVWGQQGRLCAQYLRKGSAVFVDGHEELREWDGRDGQKRSEHVLVADTVEFAGGNPNGPGAGQVPAQAPAPPSMQPSVAAQPVPQPLPHAVPQAVPRPAARRLPARTTSPFDGRNQRPQRSSR